MVSMTSASLWTRYRYRLSMPSIVCLSWMRSTCSPLPRFNAFLKTLEEPPSYVVFILATTEKHKIIPMILSRCQVYDFNRITIQDMVDHLQYVATQEGITAEASALNVIARKADGAMRDALSIFDQVAASTMGNVTYHATIENLNILDYVYYDRLTDAFLKGDVPASLLIYKEIRDKGFDSQFFINGLASHFRDLMVARDGSTISLLEASDGRVRRWRKWRHVALLNSFTRRWICVTTPTLTTVPLPISSCLWNLRSSSCAKRSAPRPIAAQERGGYARSRIRAQRRNMCRLPRLPRNSSLRQLHLPRLP